MTYMREIELVFDVASFQPGQANSPIDLWYIAEKREYNAQPCTPERGFFLQCIRDFVRSLPQSETSVGRLVNAVRVGWDMARAVTHHIHDVTVTFPTTVTKTSDSSIAVRSTVLLVPLKTKVEVVLDLRSQESSAGVQVAVVPRASVVYGEQFNAAKMTEFLASHIANRVVPFVGKPTAGWGEVILELRARLLARGQK